MGRRKYADEQVISILREGEAGANIGELCRKYGGSDATYHRWKAKYRVYENLHFYPGLQFRCRKGTS